MNLVFLDLNAQDRSVAANTPRNPRVVPQDDYHRHSVRSSRENSRALFSCFPIVIDEKSPLRVN